MRYPNVLRKRLGPLRKRKQFIGRRSKLTIPTASRIAGIRETESFMKTECYDGIRAPRWGKEEREYQTAKANRQWVYGSGKNNALMHKVLYLRLRWWVTGPGGHYLVRLSSPLIMAVTGCGRWMLLEPNHSHLCEMPRPNTVICAACEGKGRNFPKGRKHEISLAEAKIRLGCEEKK